MPKVGDKKFDYTEKGMDAAEDYAMETGQEVIPTYDAGGRVERIQGYGKGGKVKGSDYDPHVEDFIYKDGRKEKVSKYSIGERVAQRKKPSEWRKEKGKKSKKDKSKWEIDRMSMDEFNKEIIAPAVARKKATSRVTKPKKHKAKGKWFPSAKELKEKKKK